MSDANVTMKASDYALSHIVGDWVLTPAMGEYPGGVAKVVELHPDPAAPEIVMTVEHCTFGPIGVYEYEEVTPWSL